MTQTASPYAPEIPSPRGPFRLALGVLVAMTLTILKGAMTTSTGSGLAYPDWPLSNGQGMPESSYTTWPGFFEHFHRLAAAGTGMLALWLAIWLLQLLRRGQVARGAVVTAWIGGCVILAQGVVGGVGVLLSLPTVTSVSHGTLAQLTFATFAWLAYQLSDRYRRTVPLTTVRPGAGRKLAVAAIGIVVVQTVLGALARHTNSPHALWTHVANAFVVFLLLTIATAFASGRLGAAPGIGALSRWTILLLIVQISLGFVALVLRNRDGKQPENVENLGIAAVISVHVVLGAVLTMLTATLAAHVFRATRDPVEEAFA